MDEHEMSRVLAERGLGWTEGDGAWWNGDQPVENGCGYAQMVEHWNPFSEWQHAGIVIDAMGQRGLSCSVRINAKGWTTVVWEGRNGEILGRAQRATFPEALSLAAYRVIESTTANGQ